MKSLSFSPLQTPQSEPARSVVLTILEVWRQGWLYIKSSPSRLAPCHCSVMATKILVVGPIQGQFAKTFSKIAKLHAKTDFAFALVTGDLFAQDGPDDELQALLSGQIIVPLLTYFTVGNYPLPKLVQDKLEASEDDAICPNLYYLGRKGTLTTAEKVKVVFLGGRQVENEESLTQSIGKYDPLFLENEARALQGANSAHILLTNTWPARVENGSSIPLLDKANSKQSCISTANLCATLKPRYHFAPSATTCWKREPFLWPIDYSENTETQVTRFEALGDVTLKPSEWVSAFTLDVTQPASAEGAQRAAPFSPSTKRKRKPLDQDTYPNRRFDNSNARQRGGKGGKRQRYDPNDCFMCLGKPTFEADMVVSIAEESFVTSLRGPLPMSSTFPQLKSTGNLMIIPMYHAADETSHGRRARSEIASEFAEMTRYRHAFQHMLLARAKGDLGAVCWEVNRTGIRHFHWQWLACPQELIGKGIVEAAFKVASEQNQHEKFQSCDPDQLLPERQSDYFRVWIWSAVQKDDMASEGVDMAKTASPLEQADLVSSGVDEQSRTPVQTREVSIYFDLPQEQRFNIQFGRTVMAGLLKLENRADWRSVSAEVGSEARDAEAWKEDLGDYDFAMA